MKDTTKQESARNFLNKSAWIGLGIIVIVVGFAFYARVIMKQKSTPDVFKILQDQGYMPNVGLSGVFRPGNVVQVIEPGPNVEESTLHTPVLFLWGSDCFPGITPRIEPFALPQTHGNASASLTFGADALIKLIPALHMDSNAIVDYTLEIINPRVHTFAKGDLSGHFSNKCVRAYDRQIKAGDKPEWFAIILDAVVAEKLTFEMEWSSNISAEVRATATRDAEKTLSQTLKTANQGEQTSIVEVHLTNEDRKRTVFEAEGPVIIGYRARPLQRQWED